MQYNWMAFYKVYKEKVLTKSNYFLRKVGTKHTQIVHRVRLKPIEPQYTTQDIEVKKENFVFDPLVPEN